MLHVIIVIIMITFWTNISVYISDFFIRIRSGGSGLNQRNYNEFKLMVLIRDWFLDMNELY